MEIIRDLRVRRPEPHFEMTDTQKLNMRDPRAIRVLDLKSRLELIIRVNHMTSQGIQSDGFYQHCITSLEKLIAVEEASLDRHNCSCYRSIFGLEPATMDLLVLGLMFLQIALILSTYV